MTDSPLKTNLMDVIMLLLKASVLERGVHEVRLDRSHVTRAENADLHMARGLDGTVVLKLVEGNDPDNTKIIVPNGQSPLTILD